MRTFKSSVIATAAAAGIALTAMSVPAAAGHRHGNNAAALAAFAAIFGTVAAIIAAEQYRDRYDSSLLLRRGPRPRVHSQSALAPLPLSLSVARKLTGSPGRVQ